MQVIRLTPDQFEALRQTADAVVVDVRTPMEQSGGMLSGAETSDFNGGVFERAYMDWDKDKTYFMYCRSGARSGAAAQMMLQAGFPRVYNIGGYEELVTAGVQ